MIPGIRAELSEAIVKAISRYDEVEKALVFGSRARGDFRPRSDIDIAVVSRVRIPAGLASDIDEAAGLYSVDVVDYNSLGDVELARQILAHGIAIYSRE